MTPPSRFLDVTGDLSVAADAGELRVRGFGDEILVDLPGLAPGASILGYRPGRRGSSPLLRIDEALRAAGLGLIVTVKNRPIGRLGSGANPGFLDRLSGLHPMQLYYGAVLQSFVMGGVQTPGPG